MQLTVRTLDNGEAGTIDLDEAIFGVEDRPDILHRVVNWQLAKRRAGTHKAKERNEIRATTAKMYRQKGTGRARHGNAAAVQFRGGGVVHGPRVRDHAHDLPKKVRRLGMRVALSVKQRAGKLVVLDAVESAEGKTAALAQQLRVLGIESALIVTGGDVDGKLARATANIPLVQVMPQEGANVYDILRRDTLILSRDAVEKLETRLR